MKYGNRLIIWMSVVLTALAALVVAVVVVVLLGKLAIEPDESEEGKIT